MVEDFDFLLWLLTFIPAYYFGVPLLIRRQQRFPAHPKVLELDFYKMDPALARFLMSQTTALFALGFEEPTLVQLPNPAPNVTTYLIMLVNRHTGDKVMVTAILGHGLVPLQTLYVEFSTRFETGEMFDTSNCAELGAFRLSPKTVRTKVPSVTDPAELYRIHKFVMNKHSAHGNKVVYEPGQALDYLIRVVHVGCYEEQVQRGWLFYDEENDLYRTTIKGAYLIVWGLMQPFKTLRTLALHRRARKILAEFDRA